MEVLRSNFKSITVISICLKHLAWIKNQRYSKTHYLGIVSQTTSTQPRQPLLIISRLIWFLNKCFRYLQRSKTASCSSVTPKQYSSCVKSFLKLLRNFGPTCSLAYKQARSSTTPKCAQNYWRTTSRAN